MDRSPAYHCSARPFYRHLAQLTLLGVLALSVSGLTGCFGSKGEAPKPAGAAQVEQDFREKWVQRRVQDILAAGEVTNGMTARKLALAEFAEKYPYTSVTSGKP